MKKILIFLFSALILTVAGLSIAVDNLRGENERYEANQTSLLKDVEYYKTENGKNAASVHKLTLTYDELKKNYDDVTATARDLGIKVKRMESVSTSATQTEVKVITEVRDSIIYRDSTVHKIKVFDWYDPWVRVFGQIHRDSVDVDVMSRDTLVQIVHRVPHKFLFFKWGTKAIHQEIVSKNPHTRITYTEYIELKK